VANHQQIDQMRPRVLVVNFVNGFTDAQATAKYESIAAAYREATRYHGATDPAAAPFIDFQQRHRHRHASGLVGGGTDRDHPVLPAHLRQRALPTQRPAALRRRQHAVRPGELRPFRMRDAPDRGDLIVPYSSDTAAPYDTLSSDCTDGWEVYWRQSFPRLRNQAKPTPGSRC
jgi:hypothetical protein